MWVGRASLWCPAMRWFLALLFALGVLVVAGDLAVTSYIEREAAARVQQRIGAPTRVSLDGWPVTPRLLAGTGVPQAVVHAEGVPLQGGGVQLAQVDVILTDVRLPQALQGDPDVLSAASGRFTATIDQATVQALAGQATDLGQVQILADRLQVAVSGLTADLLVGARDGALVLTVANAPVPALDGREFLLPLGGLPAGASLEQAGVVGGVIQLAGPVDVTQLAAAAPAGVAP